MTRVTQIFKISTLSIGGFIGLTLYGLDFAVSAFIFVLFLSIVDTTIGLYIAHNKGIVSSRIGADGLFKKVIWLFLIAGGIVFMGNMSYVIGHNGTTVFLSAGVIILIAYRALFELISLVENIAIISTAQEKNSLNWISGVLLKIVGIGQSQIEKKIDRYKID